MHVLSHDRMERDLMVVIQMVQVVLWVRVARQACLVQSTAD